MAQPPEYERKYSFTCYAGGNPGQPLPGPKVDIELDAIARTTAAIRENLAILQRDDTKLQHKIVHPFALDCATRMLMLTDWEPKGAWAADTPYAFKDVVSHGTGVYIALEQHLSTATFDFDKATGKWLELCSGAGEDQVGATTFLALEDTPDAFQGRDMVPIVNPSNDALKWVQFKVMETTDTPDGGYGVAGSTLVVNAGRTGFEYGQPQVTELGGLRIFRVDPSNDDQALAGNGGALFDVIEAIGNNSGIAVFPQWAEHEDADDGYTRYTFKTGIIVPDNVKVMVMNGAMLRFIEDGKLVQGFGGFTVPDGQWVEDDTANHNGLWWPHPVRDTVPMAWWGATGRRSQNAVRAFKGAANSIPEGGTITALPNGQYAITEEVGVPGRLHIKGAPGATFYITAPSTRGFKGKEAEGIVFEDWIFEGGIAQIEGVKFSRCPDPKLINCFGKNVERIVRFSDCPYPFVDGLEALGDQIDDLIKCKLHIIRAIFRNVTAANGILDELIEVDPLGTSGATWLPDTSYAVDDSVISTDGALKLTCVETGVTGSTEPDWTAADDPAEIIDGTAVWTLRGDAEKAEFVEIDNLFVRGIESPIRLRGCLQTRVKGVTARDIGVVGNNELFRLEQCSRVLASHIDAANFGTTDAFKMKGTNDFILSHSMFDNLDDLVRTENEAAEGGPCTNVYIDKSVIATNLSGDALNNRDTTNNTNNVTDAQVW